MQRITSGKTILLNTLTNCTFIADDFAEEVQSGTRESDKHIEWCGELGVPFKPEEEPKDLKQLIGYKRLVDQMGKKEADSCLYFASEGSKFSSGRIKELESAIETTMTGFEWKMTEQKECMDKSDYEHYDFLKSVIKPSL